MYFLTALACSIASAILWLFNKSRKELHFEVLAISFGAATLMWLIDCIFSMNAGEGFLSFEFPTDIWISIWTIFAGAAFWLVARFIMAK